MAFRSLFLTLSLFVLIVSTLLFHKEAFCDQVTLAWDPENVPGLAGYGVYYGTVSRNYPFAVDAGNQTTVTVTGLAAGVTYYFAATAYDTAGTESPFSSEVVYTVPESGVSTSYTITASAGANGSISPSESVTQTVTACTLAVAKSGSGWGTVTRSPLTPSFPVGTVVTLTAASSWGSVFSGWSGACSGTSRTCTLTMTSDASVTATFNRRWAWGLH